MAIIAGRRGTVVARCVTGLAGLIVVVAALAGSAHANDKSDEARGQKIVTDKCGGCHAVGPTGASPHKTAPPFRTLGQRYTIESLEEALGEGLVSGHPDMPEFVFEPEDVGAIMAYLKSIQIKAQ